MCIHLHMHTWHPSTPPVSLSHTHAHTNLPPHTPTRQWFYVPCRHPVLSHFLLVCHTVSLSSSFVLPLSSYPPSRSLLPSLHPINKCWHFLPQLRKKQLKAIDPEHTLVHGRARIRTDMHTLTRKKHTHTQTRAQPWICKWVSLTFKDRGKARWLHSSWDCHWIHLSPLHLSSTPTATHTCTLTDIHVTYTHKPTCVCRCMHAFF